MGAPSRKAAVMATVAAIGAVYEAVAVITDRVPTITELAEQLPEPVEALGVLAVIAWLLAHFGWRDWLRWRWVRATGDAEQVERADAAWERAKDHDV